MFAYGLKTNIAVQIALILFFGMGLTVFMTTNVIEHLLIQSHGARGRMLVAMIQAAETSGTVGSAGLGPVTPPGLMAEAGVACMVWVGDGAEPQRVFGEAGCAPEEVLASYARKALVTGQMIEAHHGEDWGVFWIQEQALILATPLGRDQGRRVGLALMIPLGPLYGQIRKAQSLIFIYVLINGFVLTLLGVYQLSKLVVRPVQRLLRRAEDYHGNNKALTFDEKGGNEFNTLSKALNNMLSRISDDRDTLEKTIVSLERTNRELKQAQTDIIRAEKLASVGRLSSGIAHEIGNPLGIVSGYLELIKNPAIDAEQKNEFIVRAESELVRIDRIIRQLLNYSRTSSPTRTFFSVHETIGEVVDMLRVQPVMAGISLTLTFDAEKDRIRGDADHLRQVLMNLSINAADAINQCQGSPPGQIVFATKNMPGDDPMTGEPAQLKISVIDNGTGIARENLDTVFDPFFTTKEPGKGTGLGLSVCFTMVQEMGGKIGVDSTEGRGTRIEMVFPLPGVRPETASDGATMGGIKV